MSEEFAADLARVPAPMLVEQLGKALAGIPAGALRMTALVERLVDVPAPPLVKLIACAQRESVRGQQPARVVVETFAALVDAGRLAVDLRAAMIATAVMLGEDAVATLIEKPAANDVDNGRSPQPLKKGSLADTETLGRRKTLARTATSELLLKLLDDPHPDVIANVLLNPHMTEELAVRIGARRPVAGGVLEALARSRYQASAMVRRAIVLNPDCPLRLATRLVSTMSPVDLHDVVHGQGVAREIKAAARRLLDSR